MASAEDNAEFELQYATPVNYELWRPAVVYNVTG
jgi:hypothetical protein